MTLASKHDIIKGQTKVTLNVLRMDKFDFVVSHTIYKDFKSKRLIGGTASRKKSEEFIINPMSKRGISEKVDDVNKENETQLINVNKGGNFRKDLIHQCPIPSSLEPTTKTSGLSKIFNPKNILQRDGKERA
jgi:hypothetical protein